MAIIEGKPAPLFTLADQNGDKVALRDLRGRHVIVYFYPRDETPGCTKEACAFRDLFEEIAAAGATILGISPDTSESHSRFAENHALPFTLLADPSKRVMAKYGAWGEKVLYGKKRTGAIRSTVWIDPGGKVVKHWRRVGRAADHPGHVLKALQQASA